ncbi:PREDICTED: spectrin beta chain-like [Papilio polytes]|uniref:spectrin beta chain-like n=1 Tax=Papilio polytes TaxID=76194 RepID=UPI000675DCC7|nr:PREDICTED: spectrin beta chain-like [Papilio polytes]
MQVLQEEGARLQKLCPGGNEQQIALRQRALADAWAALRSAADQRRLLLHQHLELHQFLSEVRDVLTWSAALRGGMAGAARARSAAAAQAQRAHHDALRAEIDARDDDFRLALERAQRLIDAGHPAAQEIAEKCEAVVEERAQLHSAWAARQVALDQLHDLHCFLRDAKQLHELCASQEAALSTEISPTCSVEEVDNQLKKHEAFEKLLATQDEKLTTLNSHGDKLLQQNHVESQRIADELQQINERRKKLYDSAARRREQLVRSRARAQFARDAAEARAWVADKLAQLPAQAGKLQTYNAKAAAPPVAILNARCEAASDYTKRAHVFRLSCGDGAEYLFACGSQQLLAEWVAKLAFHAHLPPQLQLTPYSEASTLPTLSTVSTVSTDELRRRLHQNASSSSSAASSPEPQRAARSQAEILQQHRNSQTATQAEQLPSQRASATPERHIESAVLPSLPPRQPPQPAQAHEEPADVVLRNASERSSSPWGRSRFSNGRDLNAEFLRSQREAEGGVPPLPASVPPERPPVPDRAPALPERGPNLPERVPHTTERIPTERPERLERASMIAERGLLEKNPQQSVTALVNSYQQKMSRSWQEKDQNRNPTWQGQGQGQNNNWQTVETSHFYSTSELAYGEGSAGSTRPASVAGSGGSPALDQRPASRSSGESELSVSGVTKDKKDKKD